MTGVLCTVYGAQVYLTFDLLKAYMSISTYLAFLCLQSIVAHRDHFVCLFLGIESREFIFGMYEFYDKQFPIHWPLI